VTQRFDDGSTALQALDLEIAPRSTTVLIGPSGCGKSTVLRLITGLLQPTSGTITFDGELLTPESLPRVRRRIGYVIQEGGLFPHLTAEQNITLMARHLKQERNTTEARVKELCALTRFGGEHLGRYPVELSGGQRQRVALMRALMLKPDLLLLDEPLGALDPIVRAALQRELREIFQALEQTIVCVTHDIAEAAFLGDELVLMNSGRVVQRGTFAELRDSPASEFVTEFLHAQRRSEIP
jgi:osmoprotectant transport system ATP-binding protein